MDFIEGKDLRITLKDEPNMPYEKALHVTRQVADALLEASSKGIVHRDIKPSNIILDLHGRAYVTDFGVACLQESSTKLTQTGLFVGTPEYASPEQVTGATLDFRSDIYSLGGVLYRMLSGRPPVSGDSPLAAMVKICTEAVIPIHQINPSVPRPISDLIDKMMDKEQNRRHKSLNSLLEDIDHCIDRLHSTKPSSLIKASRYISPEAQNVPHKHKVQKIMIVLILAMFAVGSGALIFWNYWKAFDTQKDYVSITDEHLQSPEIHDETAGTIVSYEQKTSVPTDHKALDSEIVSPTIIAANDQPDPSHATKTDYSPKPVPLADDTLAVPESKIITMKTVSPLVAFGKQNWRSDEIELEQKQEVATEIITMMPIEPTIADPSESTSFDEPIVQSPVISSLPLEPTILVVYDITDRNLEMYIKQHLNRNLHEKKLKISDFKIASKRKSQAIPIMHSEIIAMLPDGRVQILIIAYARPKEVYTFPTGFRAIPALFILSAFDTENRKQVAIFDEAFDFTEINISMVTKNVVERSMSSMDGAIREYWKEKRADIVTGN